MGNAARNYIKALVVAGHNVSIRPIYNIFKSYPILDIDNDILELENNFHKKYHTLIQHCYPHQYCADSRFDQNIGIAHIESIGYNCRLDDYLQIPDKLIVSSDFVKSSILESKNFKKPILKIPIPVNLKEIEDYKNATPKIEKKHKTFYFIGDLINKNNIGQILEAFWLSFDDEESVELMIKTKNKTQEHIDLHNVVEYEFGKLENKISKNIKKPKVIIGEVKKEALFFLHRNNDCYIDISSGKNFGYSVLEALCFDNSVISLEHTAPSELVAETNNFIVNSTYANCGDDSKIYNIYNTVDQRWFKPNMADLIIKMKNAYYEDESEQNLRLTKTKEKLQQYNIDNVVDIINNYDI